MPLVDEMDARLGALDDVVAQVRDYAILALDPHGVIVSWNRGAAELKGWSAEEAIGSSFAMFYTDQDRQRGLPQELLATARDEGRVEHTGWRVRKDGTRFWGDVVITALRDDAGRLTGYTKVTRDRTEQHELEERLRTSEERLRLLVSQVVDHVIIKLDPDGVIETWNAGAERLHGWSAEEAIGRGFTVFHPDEDRDRGLPEQLLATARAQGRVEHTGWRLRQDGTRFWADVVVTALHDDDGRLTGYAEVTRDRTDVKQLEEAQDAFYTAFSHDFRTPVTALQGYVEAIREAEDDAEREFLLERAAANAERLMTMVEGLVRFARQRVATADLAIDSVDVGALVRRVVDALPLSLHPERVRVSGEGRALGDPEALRRVVANLVVNALKYSPAPTPVDVRVERRGPDHVAIVVADQGRGIAEGDLDVVFQEFQRGRLAQDDGGSGLGLASVRDLVDQQHGSVRVESQVGRGTTMKVLLPAAPEPGPSGDQSAGSGSTPTGQSSG